MLAKLLSMLLAGKGGAVAAAAIVAGATSVSVVTTSTEVPRGVRDAVSAMSQVVSPGMSELAKAGRIHGDCEGGQPVVVAQRNAADKLLRDAFQDEHLRLVHTRGGNDVDHQRANGILQQAERDLRGVLTRALNDVARETLGREGQIKVTEPTTPVSTGTATVTPNPTPSASPTPTASASPSPKPSCSPKPSASPDHAVTLTASLHAIVDTAKAEMTKIVNTAVAQVAALPPAEHGKSGEQGKPSEERGRSDEHKPADAGKPSEHPGGKPSTLPARP